MIGDLAFAEDKCAAKEEFMRAKAKEPSAGTSGRLDRKQLAAEFDSLDDRDDDDYLCC